MSSSSLPSFPLWRLDSDLIRKDSSLLWPQTSLCPSQLTSMLPSITRLAEALLETSLNSWHWFTETFTDHRDWTLLSTECINLCSSDCLPSGTCASPRTKIKVLMNLSVFPHSYMTEKGLEKGLGSNDVIYLELKDAFQFTERIHPV